MAGFAEPAREVVEAFLQALAAKDLATLEKICAADLRVELVGGAESDSFERSRSFFLHAHMELPALGFGRKPRWELINCISQSFIARCARSAASSPHGQNWKTGSIKSPVTGPCKVPDFL